MSPASPLSYQLIDQLASLTGVRDLELLEFSLLQTLRDALRPRGLTLLRLDIEGHLLKEIGCINDNFRVRTEGLTLPPEIAAADEHMNNTGTQRYLIGGEHGVTVIYALLVSRSVRSYLTITADAELSSTDESMVNGVVQICRNFFALMQQAQTDELTGLANRRTFDDCVMRVYELAPPAIEPAANERRGSQSKDYWLAMVDIDHFKLVNDRFGHLFGDEVLVLLSRLMRSSFRADDMIFRFGGEEFVLILRTSDRQACHQVLERFRRRVADYVVPQIGTVTVSIGAARLEREIFVATLLDYADQALYQSKKAGRNQLNFFEDMVASGVAKFEDIKPGGVSFF